MDLIQDYVSDSDHDSTVKNEASVKLLPSINLAPDVDITNIIENEQKNKEIKLAQKYDGPSTSKNVLNGKIEQWSMNNFTFDEQYHNFIKYGFAQDPNVEINRIVIADRDQINNKVNVRFADPNSLEFISKSVFGLMTKDEQITKQELARKRKKFGDASSGDFLGPWANYQGYFYYIFHYQIIEI